jgi:ABC-2 type transport system permease protein
MIVFRRALLDRTRTDLWWALGILLFCFINIAFYPSVEGDAALDQAMEDLPPALQELFGIQEGISLGAPAGYLQSQLFSMLPLLLTILGVAVASAMLGGAEEDGSLEFLLAQPISRRRLVLQRLFAVTVVVAAHTVLITALVFAICPLFGLLEDVDLAGLALACIGSGTLALLHSSVAFTAGAYFGRRNAAIAVASALAVAGYVAQGLLAAIDAPEALRYASPWYWFLRENMLAFGPNVTSVLPALVLALVAGLAAVPILERRDLRG